MRKNVRRCSAMPLNSSSSKKRLLSSETALERALQRGQEGLSPAETIRAHKTIYFPAQRLHFARDNPRAVADMILCNDPRLTSPRAALGGLDTRC